MTDSAIKLLPCPFCGSRDVEWLFQEEGRRKPKDVRHYVMCNHCGAQGPFELEMVFRFGQSAAEITARAKNAAIADWNTRGEIYRVALEAARDVAAKIMEPMGNSSGRVSEEMLDVLSEEYGFVVKDEE